MHDGHRLHVPLLFPCVRLFLERYFFLVSQLGLVVLVLLLRC
jgi:hypothetical protein